MRQFRDACCSFEYWTVDLLWPGRDEYIIELSPRLKSCLLFTHVMLSVGRAAKQHDVYLGTVPSRAYTYLWLHPLIDGQLKPFMSRYAYAMFLWDPLSVDVTQRVKSGSRCKTLWQRWPFCLSGRCSDNPWTVPRSARIDT
jgi:hypothetical protein